MSPSCHGHNCTSIFPNCSTLASLPSQVHSCSAENKAKCPWSQLHYPTPLPSLVTPPSSRHVPPCVSSSSVGMTGKTSFSSWRSKGSLKLVAGYYSEFQTSSCSHHIQTKARVISMLPPVSPQGPHAASASLGSSSQAGSRVESLHWSIYPQGFCPVRNLQCPFRNPIRPLLRCRLPVVSHPATVVSTGSSASHHIDKALTLSYPLHLPQCSLLAGRQWVLLLSIPPKHAHSGQQTHLLCSTVLCARIGTCRPQEVCFLLV